MIDSQLAVIRAEFPALQRIAAGRPLVYLDSAASALKPRMVIDAVCHYLSMNGSNIHRGMHTLSQEASEAFENARTLVAQFVGASGDDEIVFTKNTTEALNIVASGLSLREGDNIVGTVLDHHSNILPWRLRCEYRYANLVDADTASASTIVAALVDEQTRAIVAPLYSNVTGGRLPVEQFAVLARERGVPLVVDAAQGAGHAPLNVSELEADFVAFSGHKMCAPPGVGVLYGRREWFARVTPASAGGGTIAMLDEDASEPVIFRRVPWRFEAGTPDIAAVIGLSAAVRFLDEIGLSAIHAHIMTVGAAGMEMVQEEHLDDVFEIRTGASEDNVGIITFAPRRADLDAIRLSQILSDTYGVMTRAGNHCAHPLHKALGWQNGSLRISAHFYNTVDEMRYAVRSLAACVRSL